MSDNLKLIFAGTPDFAAAHLQALLDAGLHVAAVYTQLDRTAGRGKKLQASPVKQLALRYSLPVFQPANLKSEEAQSELAALNADLMIVVAYGLLLPQAVLEQPRLGCINVHASLLPRWRGAAPIERALLAGDTQTGVTIMQMDTGLDTGDMLYRMETPIHEEDDRVSLENRLAELGSRALLHTLANINDLRATAKPQDDSLSTYASKLDKPEALLNWNLPVAQISRCVRAGIGRLPAFSLLDGERVRLLKVYTSQQTSKQVPGTVVAHSKLPDGTVCLDIAGGDGLVHVTEMQLAGKKPMAVRDILNARRDQFAVGKQFLGAETNS